MISFLWLCLFKRKKRPNICSIAPYFPYPQFHFDRLLFKLHRYSIWISVRLNEVTRWRNEIDRQKKSLLIGGKGKCQMMMNSHISSAVYVRYALTLLLSASTLNIEQIAFGIGVLKNERWALSTEHLSHFGMVIELNMTHVCARTFLLNEFDSLAKQHDTHLHNPFGRLLQTKVLTLHAFFSAALRQTIK